MAKVLVVHSHERDEASTILAVVFDNDQGRAIADSMQRGNTSLDVISVEAVEILEYLSLTDRSASTLRAIQHADKFTSSDFGEIGPLIDRGLVEQRATDGLVSFQLTPIGHATLDLWEAQKAAEHAKRLGGIAVPRDDSNPF